MHLFGEICSRCDIGSCGEASWGFWNAKPWHTEIAIVRCEPSGNHQQDSAHQGDLMGKIKQKAYPELVEGSAEAIVAKRSV